MENFWDFERSAVRNNTITQVIENEKIFSENNFEKINDISEKVSSSNQTSDHTFMENKQKIKIGNLLEFTKGEDWLKFQENLNQLFIDLKVTDDDRKVGFLITLIGQEAYKILKESCLPESPLHKKYDDLCNTLKLQFVKKPIFKERQEFYEMLQKNTESISEWYNRLMKKSIDCKFGLILQELVVIDKFVTGLCAGPILDSLIQENTATGLSNLYQRALYLEKKFKENIKLQSSSLGAESICINNNPKPLMECIVNIPVSNGDHKKKNNSKHSYGSKQRPALSQLKEQHKSKENNNSVCKYCGGTKHRFDKCRFKNNEKSKDESMIKTVCPHLHTIAGIPEIINGKDYDMCLKCNSIEENYVCLHCHKCYCARFVNKHALEHGESFKHPLSLKLNDSTRIWCYECQAYIENPGLQNVSEAFNKEKLCSFN